MAMDQGKRKNDAERPEAPTKRLRVICPSGEEKDRSMFVAQWEHQFNSVTNQTADSQVHEMLLNALASIRDGVVPHSVALCFFPQAFTWLQRRLPSTLPQGCCEIWLLLLKQYIQCCGQRHEMLEITIYALLALVKNAATLPLQLARNALLALKTALCPEVKSCHSPRILGNELIAHTDDVLCEVFNCSSTQNRGFAIAVMESAISHGPKYHWKVVDLAKAVFSELPRSHQLLLR